MAVAAICVAALMSGCHEPVETNSKLILQFVLPSSVSNSIHNRIMGDPGKADCLELPHYAYIFAVFKMESGEYNIMSVIEKDLYEGKTSDSEVWVPAFTDGDIIYRCRITFSDFSLIIGQGAVDYCHVYAAMSRVPLALKMGATTVDENHLPTDEETVKNITFTVDNALQGELQNIYSTPYNYEIDGTYYANLVEQKVPTNIILYHVASKVDLMWNVPDETQSEMRVTKVKAKNLFLGDSYLFKPTENIHLQFTDADGYTPADLAGDIPGTWWAGRKYFYTIPYKTNVVGQFPLQVDFDVLNVGLDNTYTYEMTMTSSVPEVFVPWMRGQLTFSNAPTANRSISINVDD